MSCELAVSYVHEPPPKPPLKLNVVWLKPSWRVTMNGSSSAAGIPRVICASVDGQALGNAEVKQASVSFADQPLASQTQVAPSPLVDVNGSRLGAPPRASQARGAPSPLVNVTGSGFGFAGASVGSSEPDVVPALPGAAAGL